MFSPVHSCWLHHPQQNTDQYLCYFDFITREAIIVQLNIRSHKKKQSSLYPQRYASSAFLTPMLRIWLAVFMFDKHDINFPPQQLIFLFLCRYYTQKHFTLSISRLYHCRDFCRFFRREYFYFFQYIHISLFPVDTIV